MMRFLLFSIWRPALSLALGEVGRYRPTYPREVNATAGKAMQKFRLNVILQFVETCQTMYRINL